MVGGVEVGVPHLESQDGDALLLKLEYLGKRCMRKGAESHSERLKRPIGTECLKKGPLETEC